MKRKFKLMTSVASLCLAVALMAFGVYAAAQPKVTISGTVSYTASNVFATVKVYKGTSTGEHGAIAWGEAVKTYTINATTGETFDESEAVGNLELSDTVLAAGYKIEVINDFDADQDITCTFTKDGGATGDGIASAMEGAATQTIDNASTATAYCYTAITDAAQAQNFSATAMSLSVSIVRAAA